MSMSKLTVCQQLVRLFATGDNMRSSLVLKVRLIHIVFKLARRRLTTVSFFWWHRFWANIKQCTHLHAQCGPSKRRLSLTFKYLKNVFEKAFGRLCFTSPVPSGTQHLSRPHTALRLTLPAFYWPHFVATYFLPFFFLVTTLFLLGLFGLAQQGFFILLLSLLWSSFINFCDLLQRLFPPFTLCFLSIAHCNGSRKRVQQCVTKTNT